MLGRIANRYIKSIPKIIGMLALVGILSILSLYVVPFVNTLANDDSVTYGAGGVAGTRVYCEQDTNDFLTCPVANASAPMVDSVRGVLDNFLKIEPKLYSLDGAVYKLWSNIKDIANIFIVICFILIVISQLTGGLLSNYTIKKALPRLIVMAILVNVSYFICLIIIDVAQIAGAGVSGLFAPLRELSSVTGYTTAEKGFIQGAGATSIATGLLIYLFANKNRKNMSLVKVFTTVIAVLAACVILVFMVVMIRSVFMALLVTISPFAILSGIFNDNQKSFFRMWLRSLLVLAFLYPIFNIIVSLMLVVQTASFVTASGGNPFEYLMSMITAMVASIIPAGIIVPVTSAGTGYIFNGVGAKSVNSRLFGMVGNIVGGKNVSSIAKTTSSRLDNTLYKSPILQHATALEGRLQDKTSKVSDRLSSLATKAKTPLMKAKYGIKDTVGIGATLAEKAEDLEKAKAEGMEAVSEVGWYSAANAAKSALSKSELNQLAGIKKIESSGEDEIKEGLEEGIQNEEAAMENGSRKHRLLHRHKNQMDGNNLTNENKSDEDSTKSISSQMIEEDIKQNISPDLNNNEQESVIRSSDDSFKAVEEIENQEGFNGDNEVGAIKEDEVSYPDNFITLEEEKEDQREMLKMARDRNFDDVYDNAQAKSEDSNNLDDSHKVDFSDDELEDINSKLKK